MPPFGAGAECRDGSRSLRFAGCDKSPWLGTGVEIRFDLRAKRPAIPESAPITREPPNRWELDGRGSDEFQPDFLGKPSTIPLTIPWRLELRFRYARKARPYVLLEWYARVDSNHRPFAPEAKRLPCIFKYLHVFCGRYLDGKPRLLPGRLVDGDDFLFLRGIQVGGLDQLVRQRLQDTTRLLIRRMGVRQRLFSARMSHQFLSFAD